MYFLTTVVYNTKTDKVNAYCWGYFPSKEVAEGIIYRDRGDLHELFYPYLVIEKVEEDKLNPEIKEVAWYEFDAKMLEWKVCERPSALEHIVGFALKR